MRLAAPRKSLRLRLLRRNNHETKNLASPPEFFHPSRSATRPRRAAPSEGLSHRPRSGQDSRCGERHQRAHTAFSLLRRGSLEEVPIRIGASFDEPPRRYVELASERLRWLRR